MIQHPAVLSLTLTSVMTTVMTLVAAGYGVRILKGWKYGSGSPLQIKLERYTSLISTILAYTLIFQITSFFLLIYTADSIHTLFSGAMCAAGSFSAASTGYPLLFLKLGSTIICGIWLVINHTDTLGYDYPLVKRKYAALLLVTAFLLVECIVQLSYFLALKPDLITSCCGALFSPERQGVASELAGLPPQIAQPLFAAAAALNLASGGFSLIAKKGWRFFALTGILFFTVAVVAIISFISLYFYELPTHHCPFCILQREYLHVGYLLYGCLIFGVTAAVSAGIVDSFRREESLISVVPGLQRQAAIVALICNAVFVITSVAQILRTPFRL